MKNENTPLSDIRSEYSKSRLFEKDIPKEPQGLFEKWFNEAVKANYYLPNSMIVSTVNKKGAPSSRVVLLKAQEENRFTFFSDYSSQKAEDLEENPFASILFFWNILERQIRIEGKISKSSRESSEKYFLSRPKESQISAIISNQSKKVASYKVLEDRFKKMKEESAGSKLKPPEDWGGYVLAASRYEFWQGRENRLHDRIIYENKEKEWEIYRICP